jgi:hypothetical protein
MLKFECANNRLTYNYIKNAKSYPLIHEHGKKFINNNRVFTMKLTHSNQESLDYFSELKTVTNIFDLDTQMLKIQHSLMTNGVYGAYSSRKFATVKGSLLFGMSDGIIDTMYIQEHKLYIEGKELC